MRVERVGNLSRGVLVLDFGNEAAERDAVSPSCEEVIAALAVMAAIGLDQSASSMPDEGPSRELLERPPLPSVPAPAPLPPPTRPTHARRGAPVLALGTGIELSINRALFAAPTFFAELTPSARFAPAFRLGIARSFRERFSTAQGSASLQWSELRAGACVDAIDTRALRLGACTELELGRLVSVVEAPLPYRSQASTWLSASASVKLSRQTIRPLAFEIQGGVRVPFLVHSLLLRACEGRLHGLRHAGRHSVPWRGRRRPPALSSDDRAPPARAADSSCSTGVVFQANARAKRMSSA